MISPTIGKRISVSSPVFALVTFPVPDTAVVPFPVPVLPPLRLPLVTVPVEPLLLLLPFPVLTVDAGITTPKDPVLFAVTLKIPLLTVPLRVSILP